ncbi:MAG: hypothetical protein GF313_02540 [Caldithrix sp.]|nr:hypothetical protein [Caldithrix sp.]
MANTSKKSSGSKKTKSTTPKNKQEAKKKATKKSDEKNASKKRTSASTKTTKKNKSLPDKETTGTSFTSVAENIEEGAKYVSAKSEEIASDIGQTTTKLASDISKRSTQAVNNLLDKLKGNISEAYDASAKFAEQVQEQVQGYVEKYKNVSEIKRLKADKDILINQLGDNVYALYAEQNRKQVSFKKEELEKILKDIEKIDMTILKIGEKLDKQ